MKEEIQEAIEFLSKHVFKCFNENELNEIKETLKQILNERFTGHWYETKPMKGQAYRSIRYRRLDKDLDPVFDLVLKRCSNIIDVNVFQFPLQDFTLWIDPGEVSCRFGDSIGNSHIIARFDINKSTTINNEGVTNEATVKQEEEIETISTEQKTQQQPQQQSDVFEFLNEVINVTNDEEETQSQPQIQTQSTYVQPQQPHVVQYQAQNQQNIDSMHNLSLFDYYSCSPSSLSSSSFSSNASDGTCTPVSYYGDMLSDRSETPSFTEQQSSPNSSGSTPVKQQCLSSTGVSPSKQSAYCGYVESYPYYYKLNRLYNALAIQKLQADKMKKIMRNKPQYPQQQLATATNVSPSNTPAPTQSSIITTSAAAASSSIQIPQQQYRNTKTPRQQQRKYSTQRNTPSTSPSSTRPPLVEAYSPMHQYQQYHQQQQQQHLTPPPPQFMIPNSVLISQQQQYHHHHDIASSNTNVTPSTLVATSPPNAQAANAALFDTMNWMRGPDLVKSKN